MRRVIMILGILCIGMMLWAQDNYPVEGISDRRTSVWLLKDARVVVDHQTTLEKADVLIEKGHIKAVGENLDYPPEARVLNLEGKVIYPSFVDIYSTYALPKESAPGEDGAQAELIAMFTGQGRRGGSASSKPKSAAYWNKGIKMQYDPSAALVPDTERAKKMREAGFGAVVSHRKEGLAQGTGALINLGEGNAHGQILQDKAGLFFSFDKGRNADLYPMAQYGAIALLRQYMYDIQWYESLPEGYFFDTGLEAWKERKDLPKFFEVSNKYEVLRADKIAEEFGQEYIIKSGGDDYQLLEEVKKTGARLILPLNFPSAPTVSDPLDAYSIPYHVLKHWELAPYNPARVAEAGIDFAFTADGLSKPGDFLKNLRKAVQNGLSREKALQAITENPAKMIGAETLVGSIETGKVANLLVASGDLFRENTTLYTNWVGGIPYVVTEPDRPDYRGSYRLSVGDKEYELAIEGTIEKHNCKIVLPQEEEAVEAGDPEDDAEKKPKEISGKGTFEKHVVTMAFGFPDGKVMLSGYPENKNLKGKGQLPNGNWVAWTASYKKAPSENKSRAATKDPERRAQLSEAIKKRREGQKEEVGAVVYPFRAYGWTEKPRQETLLFTNATVWTNEKEGILQHADVLVKDGKIAAVGRDLKSRDARVIDATGMHITPGIIDEHSHIAMSSSNEMGQVITSEVRVGDIIDPTDQSIYRQLSGGVTAAQLLHGSANPIGGQSVLVKHRWGSSPGEMKIKGQVGFLKHALGENPKRSTSRYPDTRMGVEHIIRDAYTRARDYAREWDRWNALSDKEKAGMIPPRKDLELDAIVDMLEERSFMTCHTYVQSETMMIMKLAEDFGIKAHTLIHNMEGYKVADKIAEHGAYSSLLSDWWAYKFEVYEAINYNAALNVSQGVLTCIHSDNAELARHLNQEAAKAVKYGGVSEEEALKLVTLNPAKILHLEDRMGSIRKGKDADIVLWTDHPLSMYARANKTLVDGIVYFDEEKDAARKEAIEEERNRLLQKIMKEGGSPANKAGMLMRRFGRPGNN